MKSRLIVSALAAVLASSVFAVSPALAHPGEDHAPAPQSAEGEGVVRGVNVRESTVTLAHDPIAALNWPAMTMTFRVQSADLLNGVAVGSRVHFVLVNNNGTPMVSEIHVLTTQHSGH